MGKALKIFAGIILLLFIVIMVGGYIFIKTFNFNDYKNDVTELVSQKLGRRLIINGNAHIGLSLFPTIIIEDVELANTPWAKNPTMIKVKYFEIQFALIPLLKKQIEISNINLIEPQINLEIAKNGEKNWIFQLPAATTPKLSMNLIPEAYAAEVETNNNFTLANFGVQNVKITDGIINYNDRGKITTVQISDLNLSIPSLDEQITINFAATIDNSSIKGKATAGSINNFLHQPELYPLSLNLKAYGADITLDGSVSNPASDISYNFNTKIYNPSGNFDFPQTTLETQIKGNLKKITADISLLNINNNLIAGMVEADIASKIPYIKANLTTPNLDLRTLTINSVQATLIPDLISSVQASELVPATPIPYQSFSIVNADIKLTIGKLIINDTLQADNVNMTLQLKDSILAISPFKMSLGGGNVSGSLAMAAPTQRATLQIVGNKLLLQNLHKEFQISGNGDFGVSEGGNLDFDIKLKSKGNTWRSIVNNLDGQVAAVVGNTQIQTGKFKFITSTFVAQLLDILGLKKDTSQKIDIACAALHSDLSDGKATFPQGIALESKQIYLVSDGSINLQNDKIDFSIQPNIKDVNLVQAISSFIKIKGTLQNPKLTLDNTSAAKAIIGVAATGGTAYLGSQFMSSDSAPCHTALKGTVYASRFPAPQGAINNAKDVYQGAEKQINKSIKDLKNTAKDVINIFKNSLKSNKIETSNGAQ